jgi:hypothetical protein
VWIAETENFSGKQKKKNKKPPNIPWMTPDTHSLSIVMEKTRNKIIHNDALILMKVTCLNIGWCRAFRSNTSLLMSVFIGSLALVPFGRVRETSTSRKYATTVCVALGLNIAFLVTLEGGRLRLQWIVVWRHFSRSTFCDISVKRCRDYVVGNFVSGLVRLHNRDRWQDVPFWKIIVWTCS